MSLNHFVPFKARVGKVRRWIRRRLPTWMSSPARRVVQATALLLFLALFFYVAWPYGSADYTAHREAKELIDAEAFLALDPLVSVSTAIAGRTWVWSLLWAGGILLVGVLFPRGFCGYLCPLGTIIDIFDWLVGKRVTRFRLPEHAHGWWVHIKYYLLLAVLICSVLGVMIAGVVAAIPVVTRGLQFAGAPLETGLRKGWYLIPPMNAGHFVSLALFAAVLLLGLMRPRFWCRYVCPTGALLSVGNAIRLAERKVEASCINCHKCVEICPFDAIKEDYTTRTADCTLCQTCGGVCPTQSIKFVSRFNDDSLKAVVDPRHGEQPLSRRGFIAGTGGALAIALAGHTIAGKSASGAPVVRPPGSVPEEQFLDLCIRCGECFKACPNNVLQPIGFEQRGRGIWTPHMVADWSGCEPSCNNCGQVCPTGAIRALPLAEKRVARMGLAIVNETTCLPFAGVEACQMCVDECNSAGYHAIEFIRVHPNMKQTPAPADHAEPAAQPQPVDEGETAPMEMPDLEPEAFDVPGYEAEPVPEAGDGEPEPLELPESEPEAMPAPEGEPMPVPATEPAPAPVPAPIVEQNLTPDEGFLAPLVDPLKCVGCGLCQTRCFKINAKTKGLMRESAIIVEAGVDPTTKESYEDRIRRGSYVQLRTMRERKAEEARKARIKESGGDGSYFVPEF